MTQIIITNYCTDSHHPYELIISCIYLYMKCCKEKEKCSSYTITVKRKIKCKAKKKYDDCEQSYQNGQCCPQYQPVQWCQPIQQCCPVCPTPSPTPSPAPTPAPGGGLGSIECDRVSCTGCQNRYPNSPNICAGFCRGCIA